MCLGCHCSGPSALRNHVGSEDLDSNGPAKSNQPVKADPYFARSMYSPVVGLTRTFSPVLMNSGTLTVTPFSRVAGLVDAVFVAVFMTGAVSTTSSVSVFGN